MNITVQQQEIGIMGTGTNMFRCGLAHSSGRVFVGTYGPAPAIVWEYDAEGRGLKQIAAPGEYQLDCMVEAPNGKIYIGTAYKGLVYELDSESGKIRDLGSPPIDSTPWIFSMVCTRDGEIYGAKGVGLFHLDWRTGKMESCGLVPGNHSTGGIESSPIVRSLEERPDGLLWGDTNRWIFTLDPKTRQIELVADIGATDEACYAVLHSHGPAPVNDLYFQVYSRFSGKTPRQPFRVWRTETSALEDFPIEGLDGFCWIDGWWMDGETPRLLVTHKAEEETASTIAIIDIEKKAVIDRWAAAGNETPPQLMGGGKLWFLSLARGTLFRSEPEQKRLVPVATNPIPVECRCLAISASRRLGTDTYDCGFIFTRGVRDDSFIDHGRVWLDDHRCNYGPASFGGADDRYFLANHGEGTPSLWVTDLQTQRHWSIGESVIQLVRMRDGSVWGTQGENPPSVVFDALKYWTPAWHARPGRLFRWCEGADSVETYEATGPVGPLAEMPGPPGSLAAGCGDRLLTIETYTHRITRETRLPAPIAALASDFKREILYGILESGALCFWRNGELNASARPIDFGPAERGFFVLTASGWLVGVARDGTVSVYKPETGEVIKTLGLVPPPAGPAVSLSEDKWYYADQQVVEYSISEVG